jgi:hypothetical protein
MAFIMFRDFDDETVRHGDHLPCVTDGSVGSRLPPEPAIVAVPCRLSSDLTLQYHGDSAAALIARDSQQVGASSADNNGTNGARLADELCHIALTQTDFLGDLVPGDPVRIWDHAANAIDWAVEIHEELHPGVTVPLEVVEAARKDLTQQAHDILADQAQLEDDALLDAQQAGDLDHDGSAISYPRYYGV